MSCYNWELKKSNDIDCESQEFSLNSPANIQLDNKPRGKVTLE